MGWLSQSARNAYPLQGVPREGEKIVLRKLSVALVGYAIKVFDQKKRGEEGWEDWLLEVIVRVAASGSRREAGLEVLSTAIEQVQRAELTGNKR